MMKHLRLALVTPRYWPQVGDAERFYAQLAEAFLNHGARPSVVTARWSAGWPGKVLHRDVPVIRLRTSPRGGWSTLRHMRELSRWLRQNSHDFDLVHIAHLRYDAYAAIGAMRERNLPVVCRLHMGGLRGDCRWQEAGRLGRRIRHRCRAADAILAATRSLVQELLEAGYDPVKIHQIPYGASGVPERTLYRRFQARRALAQVNHDLSSADYAPIAICLQRLERRHGLQTLVSAWRDIATRWPSAKLWLIGDGPFRPALYERIVDFGLQHQILMPGSFDDLEDLFFAADVVVAPSSYDGGSPSLVAALAAGLPVVASESTENRNLIDDDVHGLLVPAEDVGALTGAISRLFEMPALAARLGAAAQLHALRDYSLDRVAGRHLELFSQLVENRRRGTA